MKNIYQFTILKNIAVGMYVPLWILYLADLDYTLLQIGLIGAIYETIKFITEIPFGILADKYGIKFSILSSSILALITWITFTFFKSNQLFIILFGIGMWALSESFFSGAFETWIAYETKQANFSNEMYKVTRISVVSMLVGSLLGGVIYFYWFKFVFALVSILVMPLILLSFGIPNYKKNLENSFNLKSGLKLILASKKVKIIIISGFFTALTYDTISNFYPAYFKFIKLDSRFTSISFTVAAILLYFLLLYGQKKSQTNQIKHLMLIDSIGMILIFILTLGFKLTAFISNSVLLTFEDLRSPLVLDIINQEIPNEFKSTTYSINSIFDALGEIFAGIIFGIISQYFGIKIMLLSTIMGLIFSNLLYSRIKNNQ